MTGSMGSLQYTNTHFVIVTYLTVTCQQNVG